MPRRRIPLIEGETYHVFNRGIAKQPTFIYKREYKRALKAIAYYQFNKPPMRLSKLLELSSVRQSKEFQKLTKSAERRIDILCYCLMPNHFHFLLRQNTQNGISKFIGQFLNSYTKYFNKRRDRDGALFLDKFKAVRIEDDKQLAQVSRYIHLNPYSGKLISKLGGVVKYPWSSMGEYVNPTAGSLSQTELILSLFTGKATLYRDFVFNRTDYQKKLKYIRHLTLE